MSLEVTIGGDRYLLHEKKNGIFEMGERLVKAIDKSLGTAEGAFNVMNALQRTAKALSDSFIAGQCDGYLAGAIVLRGPIVAKGVWDGCKKIKGECSLRNLFELGLKISDAVSVAFYTGAFFVKAAGPWLKGAVVLDCVVDGFGFVDRVWQAFYTGSAAWSNADKRFTVPLRVEQADAWMHVIRAASAVALSVLLCYAAFTGVLLVPVVAITALALFNSGATLSLAFWKEVIPFPHLDNK
jgi:hypothetical protein